LALDRVMKLWMLGLSPDLVRKAVRF